MSELLEWPLTCASSSAHFSEVFLLSSVSPPTPWTPAPSTPPLLPPPSLPDCRALHSVRRSRPGRWTLNEMVDEASSSPSVRANYSSERRDCYFGFRDGGELRSAAELCFQPKNKPPGLSIALRRDRGALEWLTACWFNRPKHKERVDKKRQKTLPSSFRRAAGNSERNWVMSNVTRKNKRRRSKRSLRMKRRQLMTKQNKSFLMFDSFLITPSESERAPLQHRSSIFDQNSFIFTVRDWRRRRGQRVLLNKWWEQRLIRADAALLAEQMSTLAKEVTQH